MKKLVILSSRFPYPLEKGDKLRLYHQIKHLSKYFDIHLLCTTELDISQEDVDEVSQYCKGLRYFKIERSLRVIGLGLNIFSRLPFQVKYFFDKKIKRQIEEKIASIQPDAVYCQLIRMAPYASTLNYPLIIDYMDAFSLIMWRQYEHEKRSYKKWFYKLEARRAERYEKAIQHDFQQKTIISEQDKVALDRIPNLHVISNGVDTKYFKSKNTAKKYDILFAGNMGYKPNIAAARYLINEVVESKPLKVLIAGARPVSEVTQLESDTVTVSGWMEDMRDAYDQSRIFVAPIFQGAGQQNKILQAMAMGVPCITTSQVNNAIGAIDGESILIANDAITFKAHIKMVLENSILSNKIAMRARELVESKYSWENQNAKLVSLISDMTE